MNKVIAGYVCLTPMQTTGSGSARWCIAARGAERFFLKEFLSPVYPADPATGLGRKQLERCRRFETRKQNLYAAASCVIGGTLMPVVDFFRDNGRYYAVTEWLGERYQTADTAFALEEEDKRQLLFELAQCLQRMHRQGIVHADLKPDHVLYTKELFGCSVKIIDLDSGFLAQDPPASEKDIEGDPAYLAPETFLRMVGEDGSVGAAADTFALGALIHVIWTGRLPAFDTDRYHYLYEAALDNADIHLKLPRQWMHTVRRMLNADATLRPSDAEVTALFAPRAAQNEPFGVHNGLVGLMKKL